MASDSRVQEVLRLCLHWRDVAHNTDDLVLKMQHVATSLAMLNAARCMTSDRDLEQLYAIDVTRLMRSLESLMTKTRQSVAASVTQTTSSATDA